MTNHKTIYRFQNGSQMYGLATPKSDVDFMEVFLPSSEELLGLHEVEIIDASTKGSEVKRRNSADDVDDARYSFKRYLGLLEANNPNILETLFVPDSVLVIKDPCVEELLQNYTKIVSKKSYATFKGYAKSQEHKLNEKKARYDELVKAVAFLERVYPTEILDATSKMSQYVATELNVNLKHYKGAKQNVESFHEGLPMKVIYEKLVEERDTYGWRVKTDTFLTLGYDCKFGYHLARLYYEAIELLTTGRISFPFVGQEYDVLMNIKTGKVTLAELQALCIDLAIKVDQAYAVTSLPERADHDFINSYCIKTLENHLKE